MAKIRKGKQIVFEGKPTIELDPLVPPVTVEEISTKRIAELIDNFTETEAKAACKVLVQNYPGLYFDVFIREYADKAAKLEAIKAVCERS